MEPSSRHTGHKIKVLHEVIGASYPLIMQIGFLEMVPHLRARSDVHDPRRRQITYS